MKHKHFAAVALGCLNSLCISAYAQTLQVNAGQPKAGILNVTVSWQDIQNVTSGDWIGLFQPSADSQDFISYFHTDVTGTWPSGSGSYNITLTNFRSILEVSVAPCMQTRDLSVHLRKSKADSRVSQLPSKFPLQRSSGTLLGTTMTS